MLYFIGRIKETDQQRREKIYYRLYDTSDKSIQDITTENLRVALKTDNIIVNNLGIDESDNIIGTCGKIDRYATLAYPVDEVKQRPIVITARRENKYSVVDIMGKCKIMDYKEAVNYCEGAGIANAKVVKRGNKRVLSAISGTFDTRHGGRLSDEIDESYNRCLKLREENKLTQSQLELLSQVEKTYLKRMHTLRVKENRGLASALDVMKVTPIMSTLTKIETDLEDNNISSESKKVKKKFSECKGRYKALVNTVGPDNKIIDTIKYLQDNFDRSRDLYDDCEINSDEYLRRLGIISNRLDAIADCIVDRFPVPGGVANA